MSVNIRYTRAELLALAHKQHEYNLTAGALQKFKVIEAESLVPEASPSESHRNDTGGRKGEGKNGAGSRRAANTERFAPPARISRGNKDQEAFEEGYKYELERNAMKKQALQETMAKEKEKIDAVAASKGEKGETKQEVAAPAEKEEPKLNEDEEVERWMTSIAMNDEGTKKVTKSRFFSGTDSDNKGAAASPLTGGSAFNDSSAFSITNPSKDPWAMQGVMPTGGNAVWGNMETQRNSGVGLTPSANSVAAPSVVVGSVQLPMHSGVSAPSSTQMVAAGAMPAMAAPAPAPAPATVPGTAVPLSTSQKTTTMPAAAPPQNNSSTNPSTQVWNAQDLEQMLLSGQKVNKQPKQEAAKPKVIDAAALESQLLLQVQKNMTRSQQQTQAHVQQQQQQPPPPPQLASMGGTPPTIPISGQRRPPQPSLPQPPQQIPPQQPVPIPWGTTMQKVPPQQIQQKIMQPQPQPQPQHRHPSMPQPVPFIISGAQGAPYFPQQAMHGHYVTGFMPGQGQQPMMVYRSPDGTTQYAVGSAGYPPNAQLLFSQPQQQQPQRR